MRSKFIDVVAHVAASPGVVGSAACPDVVVPDAVVAVVSLDVVGHRVVVPTAIPDFFGPVSVVVDDTLARPAPQIAFYVSSPDFAHKMHDYRYGRLLKISPPCDRGGGRRCWSRPPRRREWPWSRFQARKDRPTVPGPSRDSYRRQFCRNNLNC